MTSRRMRNASTKPVAKNPGGLRRSSLRQLETNSKSDTAPTSPAASTISSTNVCETSASPWTDDSVAQVALWWNIDEQGVAKLWQLRERLKDVRHWKNQPHEVVRYLRDAHGNVKNAELKFRRMVQWRVDQDVDAIVRDYRPPHPLMAEYLPTTVLEAEDRDGDPIWLERVGAADSWGLLQAFGQDPLLRYAVYIREVCIRGEWAREYQSRHGKPPSRATAIIDLGGMGWDHCRPALLPLLKEGLQIIQDYYVGFGKKVIVIRVSKLFPLIWKVAQHFCGENLKNMLVFANSDNYLQVLEEYVHLESLPPCIYPGGKGRGGVAMPNNLEGGKVPTMEELDRIWAQRQQEQGVPAVVKETALSTSSSSLTEDEGPPSPLLEAAASSSSSSCTIVTISDPKNAVQPENWSYENFQNVMTLFCASDEETAQIRDLQTRLADVNHWKNNPQALFYFLRDSNHKVHLAETRFRHMIQWRLDNNVDTILDTYRPPKLMLEYFSATILRPDCCDRDGDPIYVERPGETDQWALYRRFGKQGILTYITWLRENAARGPYGQAYERLHGRRIAQVSVVVDCQGLSSRHMKPGLLPLFRSIMEVAQAHYCGMAKRIFVIRAPRIFKVIWALVHHFLNDKMKDLLVFCSVNDYLDVMGEYMDINHLPPCIYEHGRGEGGPGMPKKLDSGMLPPPTEQDHDVATREDIDPGYAVSRRKAREAEEAAKHGHARVVRLGGGVFDFTFCAEDNSHDSGDTKVVVTLAR